MSWRYDCANPLDAKNAYISETEFVCNLIVYEQNVRSGKCYKHNPLASSLLGRIKRKISKQEFEERKEECLKAVMSYEQSRSNE